MIIKTSRQGRSILQIMKKTEKKTKKLLKSCPLGMLKNPRQKFEVFPICFLTCHVVHLQPLVVVKPFIPSEEKTTI